MKNKIKRKGEKTGIPRSRSHILCIITIFFLLMFDFFFGCTAVALIWFVVRPPVFRIRWSSASSLAWSIGICCSFRLFKTDYMVRIFIHFAWVTIISEYIWCTCCYGTYNNDKYKRPGRSTGYRRHRLNSKSRTRAQATPFDRVSEFERICVCVCVWARQRNWTQFITSHLAPTAYTSRVYCVRQQCWGKNISTE